MHRESSTPMRKIKGNHKLSQIVLLKTICWLNNEIVVALGATKEGFPFTFR